MQETKVKKRGWVKNAAIIFLSVMLVLTFFSNTIMNMSLPEVATKAVSSGTITAKIRGSGVVKPYDSYEVKLSQTREIESVSVKLNQEISTGDLLFTLAGKESDELKNAQEQLENLEDTYRRALLSQSETDYAKEDRDIRLKMSELSELEKTRDETVVSSEKVDSLKIDLDVYEYRKEVAETEIEALKQQLQELEDTSGNSSQMKAIREQIEAKTAELESIQNSQSSDNIAYRDMIEQLKLFMTTDPDGLMYKDARKEIINLTYYFPSFSGRTYAQWFDYYTYLDSLTPPDSEDDSAPVYPDGQWAYWPPDYELPYRSAAEFELGEIKPQVVQLVGTAAWQSKISVYLDAQVTLLKNSSDPSHRDMVTAYEALGGSDKSITEITAEIEKLQLEYDNLAGSDNTGMRQNINNRITELSNSVKDNDKKIEEISKELTEEEAEYNKAKETKETAIDRIKDLQLEIENLLFNLAQQQKTDSASQALANFDLDIQRREINRQKLLIEELKSEEVSSEYLSPVSGKVTALNIKPGTKPDSETVLVTIEMTDLGYYLEATITEEQSRRVSVGEKASVTGNFWGPQISLTLTNIRNDPESPRDKRILTFKAEGEVESGTQVNFELGNKGVQYELIVPNSAVFSDSNGNFVLLFTTKSMAALGDRYVAQRVDVNVLDSDDTNSAVSGGLTNWDFVITSSNKPIESGMYVRMSK